MKTKALISTFFMLLLIATCMNSNAQTIASGGKMTIVSGTVMTSTNNLAITSGGTLDNQGTLILKKNLINQNASPTSLGSGTLELSGTTSQSVSGQSIVQNLTVNNSSGVTVDGNTQVNGTLTLTSGVVSLGSYNLTLGPSALVSGTPTASNMITPEGTGQLRKQFSSAGSFLFPVGDVTGTAEYSPVTLNFTSGTFGSGNYAAVNLTDNKYPSGDIVNNYLTRYWTLAQNNITNFNCNATFKYLPADVTGTESAIYCVKVNPAPWIGYDLANTGTHQLTANGLTSFSTFTGVGVHKAALTVFLQGLYAGGGIMNKAQDEYGDHFPGNTADQVTVELHDASNYSNIIYTSALTNLSTSGQVSLTAIPPVYSGSYYTTIRHRNSIETTSATFLSYSGSLVTYNFSTAASKAYGDNQIDIGSGVYAIYGGDVNQDGIVDGGDMNPVDNASTAITFGYVVEDVNGDGIVDGGDMNIVDNNSTAIVMAQLP